MIIHSTVTLSGKEVRKTPRKILMDTICVALSNKVANLIMQEAAPETFPRSYDPHTDTYVFHMEAVITGKSRKENKR